MATPTRIVERQDIERLSARAVRRFRNAIARSLERTDRQGADYWAGIYGRHLPAQKNRDAVTFLAWNRAHLRGFERTLQEQDADVSLPWWDLTSPFGRRRELPIAFTEHPDTNPLASGQIPRLKEEPDSPRGTRRAVGLAAARLPTGDDIRAALAQSDYITFATQLEHIDNTAHLAVGGDMADISVAAYDPLNWCLGVMVDRIWHVWQLLHPGIELPPDLLDQALRPFDLVVGDVMDVRALGYDYPPFLGAGGPSLTRYASDLIDPGQPADDLLGLTSEIDAFASLIAQRDVRPPLAIGLFGDWGSGKSFFMRLLAQRVDEIAKASADVPSDASAFCCGVRQITFNAWHYADANLWASLVLEIFSRLAEPGSGDAPSLKLPSVEELRADLEKQSTAAESEVNAAQDELTKLRDAQSEPSTTKAVQKARDVAALADDPELRKAAEKLGEIDGADRLTDDALDAMSVAARGEEIGRYLGDHHGALALTVIAAIVAVAGVVLFPDSVGALVSVVGAALALFTGVLRPLQTVDKLAKFGDEVNRQVKRKLADEEQAAKQRRDAALAAKKKVDDELQLLETGAGLKRFLGDRAASDDYRSQLGIVALVRRDLEQLSRALKADGSPIERIILYIDDLDRCPAERVVEVLEAVHLLLAFDLFVVVVGVDSRWLLSSLRQVYAAQFATTYDEALWATTPQNYLEKIFQIPYAVPAMAPGAFERFVGELLSDETASAANIDDGDERPDAGDNEAPAASRADPELTTPEPPQGSGRRPLDLRPPSLDITRDEVTFLASLGRLVPSPRAGKRLINTYRLLRAPLSDAELRDFGRPDGDCRIVASLLAIMAGFPGESPRLFGALLSEPDEVAWADFSGRVRAHVPTGVDAARWGRLGAALETLDDELGEDRSLEGFRRWVPRVARYSFETSRLAAQALTPP